MRQLLRYGAVGVINTGLGYAVIFGCMYLLELGAVTSNVVGYATGLLVSFILNRTFTFRSTGAPRAELVRFVAIFALAYAANLIALLVLARRLDVHEGVAQLIAGVVYFGLSYLLNKYYVFRRS